jgi:hypothetical protein
MYTAAIARTAPPLFVCRAMNPLETLRGKTQAVESLFTLTAPLIGSFGAPWTAELKSPSSCNITLVVNGQCTRI